MIKQLSFMAFCLFLLGTIGCDKESNITITFEEPTNEATVSDPKDVHIHIDVSSDEEFDVFRVTLENETTEKTIAPLNPFEKHVHGKTYEFEQEMDLSSYPSGTEFHLEVEICKDHDCKEIAKTEAIHFKI